MIIGVVVNQDLKGKIENQLERGYWNSRSEFCRTAIIEKLMELEK